MMGVFTDFSGNLTAILYWSDTKERGMSQHVSIAIVIRCLRNQVWLAQVFDC